MFTDAYVIVKNMFGFSEGGTVDYFGQFFTISKVPIVLIEGDNL